MMEQDANDKRQQIREIYRYDEMSNKVLRADKRLQTIKADPIQDAEKSQPKSMSGRISAKEMGMNARHETTLGEEAKRELERKKQSSKIAFSKKTIETGTILDSTNPSLRYYPKNEANFEVYEEILRWVSDLFGNDMPHDIIESTADLLIYTFKESEDEADGLLEKKKDLLQKELSVAIDQPKFHNLVKLMKQITDYSDNSVSGNDKVVPIFAEDASDASEEEEVSEQNALLEENSEDESSPDDVQHKDDAEPIPQLESETVIFAGEETNKMQDLMIYAVDEFFVRRKLNESMGKADPTFAQRISDEILIELENNEENPKALEQQLIKILDFDHLQLVEFLVRYRSTILWGTRLAKTEEDEKPQIIQLMNEKGLFHLVKQYEARGQVDNKRSAESISTDEDKTGAKRPKKGNDIPLPSLIDLENLKFDEGAKLMTVTRVALPEGSFKKVNEHYEEIHVPAPTKPIIDYSLVPTSELPEWAQGAFPKGESDTLNAIQSKVFPAAFDDDINILLCAPTGAGKTNVAMLSILQAISSYINPEKKELKTKQFKIVYLAPLKALVQEQVREFRRRLSYLGIKVAELTGDSNLSREQIRDTQLLVSTPEKWDVITRKAADSSSFAQLVRLLIIDEVHLLHDQRGPVLESIVARSLQSNVFQSSPRLVGLSATLPNYEDVARFLRVPSEGLFYFDSSFRPCPLSQQFCGVTEKNSIKRMHAANEACYDKTLQAVDNNHQVIIFVHSRKDTARVASYLRDKFIESGNIGLLQKSDEGSRQILITESENLQDSNLKKVLKYGIGIHHAGLSRSDRSLSEDLFADGLLQVLVSTATLAWGVNLPAHTVIVKGTEVYSPEKGKWDQLSPQDLLQMLGRAGRPRYDTHGEGIIITNQSDVQYYLAVLNQQLPIESQFISMLVDNLNAEVVSGNINSREDAVNWMSYTYLYVRMLVSPSLYKVPEHENDESLYHYRQSLVHSALSVLHKENLVVYNPRDGHVQSTELGRIASYFYIRHTSMVTYSMELTQHSTQIDLFRILGMSDEFKYISVRPEERKELKELLEKAPVPIRESVDESLAKVNILLQSYISRLNFDGFALNADMAFIIQNAGRISRALYEYSLKTRCSRNTKALLNLCMMIERRTWVANSPLRQIKSCPPEVIRKMEASTLPWHDYLELDSPAEVGQAVRSEKHGKMVYDLLQRFPKLSLRCSIQPITRSLLKFELEVLPEWTWDDRLHGRAEPFVVLMEDTDGEKILYSSTLLVRKEAVGRSHVLEFTLQLSQMQQRRLPPNFFVSIFSERWIGCESQLAVNVEQLRLPKKFPPPTPLVDMAVVPTSELEVEEFRNIFNFQLFNKFQSQTFHSVYNSNENILVGASKGSGKTTIAELALLNHWRQNKGRALYICPQQEKIDRLTKDWGNRLSSLAGGKNIDKLGSDSPLNLRIIAQSHLVLATPEQFDTASRRWRQRKNLQNIELIIYDDAHEIFSGLSGAVYETVISRMAFISNQLEKDTRIVTLASCIANGRDFGEWLGVSKNNTFNFSPSERINPIEIHLHSFNDVPGSNFNRAMTRLAFEFAHQNAEEPAVIFLPTRKTCLQMCNIFAEFAETKNWSLIKFSDKELSQHIADIEDRRLKEAIVKGIGILYEGMMSKERKIIENLFERKMLSLLFVTKDCSFDSPSSALITILGTQYYEGKEHRFVTYSANEILEMVGSVKPGRGKSAGKALILTSFDMKDYYKKFLTESLPVESYMYFNLHDLLATEISTSVIQSKQDCVDWLAYTYFYRRLHANPSFYGIIDASPYGISVYLTELVENTLLELQESSMIEVADEARNADSENEGSELITPLNGCLISSHYNVSFLTMQMFLSSLSGSATLHDILRVLSKAAEFEIIPLREDDFAIVKRLQESVPLKIAEDIGSNLLSSKVFILLQAHFSRVSLPVELQFDLKAVLEKSVHLINAIADILSGDGRLNAMTAMDVSQLIVQGVWDVDSPLKQIPYFDDKILAKCADKGVETVYDIMALEEEEREEIITLENDKLIEVARFVNNYPNIELEYSLDQTVEMRADEPKTLSVRLTRDDVPETLQVTSERYPFEKLESWWLVLGETSTKELHAIKKVSLRHETQSYELSFTISEGSHRLTVWCICDSYLDADKEVSFDLTVT